MLIYLDVETTGLAEGDRICALGAIGVEADRVSVCGELIHPQQKIRADSMMIHHITNEMVKQESTFDKSSVLPWLQERNHSDHTLVLHHSSFDMTMLQKEGFVWQGKIIDTLRCTQHLIPDCDQFSLQFLRYELQLYKTEESMATSLGITIQPHHALSDALHVKLLYEYLRALADENTLLLLTQTPVLIQKFPFGKYQGRYIEEIVMYDSGYVQWLRQQLDETQEDLHHSLDYYLSLL